MAGTVIDSLITEFVLDASKFTAGQKVVEAGQKKLEEASTKTTKATEANAGKQSLALNEVAQSALKMFAVFTAGKGLEQFVSDTVKGNAALGRTATNLNMSAGALSKWQNAFERGGGTASGLTGALSGLTTEIEKFRATGKSDALPWLNRLGIDLTDEKTGKLKDNTQILLELADKLHSMPVAQANFFGSQIGIDQSTLNVLIQGRQALEDLLDTQEKIGHTTDADAAAAKVLNQDLIDLKQSSTETGTAILTDLTPQLDGLLKSLLALSEWGRQNKGIAEVILGVGGIAGFATTVSTLRKLLGLIGLGGGGGAGVPLAPLVVGGGAAYALTSPTTPAEGDLAWVAAHPGLRSSPRSGSTLTEGPTLWDRARNALSRGLFPGSYIVNKLMGMGWTREQASGIAGNIMAESGGNPSAFNPAGGGHGARGIAQWRGPRQDAFAAFAGHTLERSSLDEQLAFINKELREGQGGAQLSAASSAAEASAAFTRYFERPDAASMGQEINKRIVNSNAIYANGSSSGGGNSSSVNIGSINVHTQATDAQGIAKSIGPVVKSNLLATQANTGLQ